MAQLLALRKTSADSESQKSSNSDYSLGYIPALDGLRAIAILLVLFCHNIGPVTVQLGNFFNGWLGVDLFFVISGFLITSILLKEAGRNSGNFSLRNFYVRRWLRICPAYFAFIGVVALWHLSCHNSHLRPLLCAVFYLTNLDLAFAWNFMPQAYGLAHLWSLGMEEQFYLLWPACLKGLKKHALGFVGGLVVCIYLWKLYLFTHGANWLRLRAGFDTGVDTIMCGVFLALLLTIPKCRNFIQKLIGNSIAQVVIASLMLCAFHWANSNPVGKDQLFLFWALKMPTVNLLIVLLLSSILCNAQAFMSRLLSNPVMVFIGKLSYSLYLWHMLIHTVYRGAYWNFCEKHGAMAELYQYILIFACAAASYYLIEKPFLKLKSRFN